MTEKTPQTPDATNLLRDFWAQYKYAIIGLLIAIFVGATGYQGYKKLETFNQNKQATAFWQAWQNGSSAALQPFANNSSDGYRMLSLFEGAKAASDKKAYFENINTSGLAKDWRDLLAFYQGQTALAENRYEDALSAFTPLTKGNSWLKGPALEGLGQAAYFAGHKADALAHFEAALEVQPLPAALKRRLLARISQLEMEATS